MNQTPEEEEKIREEFFKLMMGMRECVFWLSFAMGAYFLVDYRLHGERASLWWAIIECVCMWLNR